MVARLGRVDPRSNERRVRPWRPVGRMDPYSQDRQLLRVGVVAIDLKSPKTNLTCYSSTLIVFLLFALTNFILAILSTPSSATVAYVVSTFFNGLFIGASMNYALSHMLHLTNMNVHYIVTSLLGMFRGSAGSFGSAIGGGFFQRELKKALEKGFSKHGLSETDELVRKLLGSPALVTNLSGLEKEVAIQSYEQAVKVLILGGCVLALVATMLQACTGWRAPHEVEKDVHGDLEDRLDRE